MKLYTHSPSPNCLKVRALANLLGLRLEEVEVDPHRTKQPEFLSINPNGKVPTLEDGDLRLWESNAIMVYLAQKAQGHHLLPLDPPRHAELWRWMSWGMCHWGPVLRTLMMQHMVKPMVMGLPPDMVEVRRAEEEFHPLARILEDHLKTRDYLLGSGLTLADLSLAASLVYAPWAGIPWAGYPHLQAWYGRVASLPAWQAALPQMPEPTTIR